MNEVTRKNYLQTLARYVENGTSDSLYEASSLGGILRDMLPHEVIEMHEESIRTLIANVDSEEALRYYHLSFVFLMEIMVGYRVRNTQIKEAEPRLEPSQESSLRELRDLLLKSHHSFQMVKSKYETVLQHMDSGIALFDSEGFVTFINLQMGKLLGVPRRALLGCDLPALLRHPKLSRDIRRNIYRVYKDMFVRRIRFYELFIDGKHLLITATYGEELYGDLLLSVKDVTDFKKIEETAYRNDKLAMLGKISASIAHEIRNPLTSIRGFIQLLKPHLAKLGKEQYAEIIVGEIDRANEIIHEFLNSSKPTAPVKQQISVAALLKEAVLLSESEALLRGCQIVSRPVDPEISVYIDVKQVKQVILNMVKNAVDAVSEAEMSRPGLIQIYAEWDGSNVRIHIEDNGKGMDQVTLSKLFDPFFTTKEEGTGLGLSVCYRIIRNHGGSIKVDSVLGEGTVFQIILPA